MPCERTGEGFLAGDPFEVSSYAYSLNCPLEVTSKSHRVFTGTARDVLTQYSSDFCRSMTHDYWEFGDELWMQYRFRM